MSGWGWGWGGVGGGGVVCSLAELKNSEAIRKLLTMPQLQSQVNRLRRAVFCSIWGGGSGGSVPQKSAETG